MRDQLHWRAGQIIFPNLSHLVVGASQIRLVQSFGKEPGKGNADWSPRWGHDHQPWPIISRLELSEGSSLQILWTLFPSNPVPTNPVPRNPVPLNLVASNLSCRTSVAMAFISNLFASSREVEWREEKCRDSTVSNQNGWGARTWKTTAFEVHYLTFQRAWELPSFHAICQQSPYCQ